MAATASFSQQVDDAHRLRQERQHGTSLYFRFGGLKVSYLDIVKRLVKIARFKLKGPPDNLRW